MSRDLRIVVFLEGLLKVKGSLHLEEGFRLSDYLNAHDHQFIPLKAVEVTTKDDTPIFKSGFLCINKKMVLFAKEENV